MNPDLPPARRPPVTADSQTIPAGSYVDWAAIIAGTVLALAFSFLMISFGAGLGLSLTSPYRGEGMSAFWLVIAAGLWLAWVMVTGFGAGGYLTGRMRRRAGDALGDEVTARDGMHGLTVWATGVLVGTVLAAAGVGGLVSAGTSVLGSTAETVTDVATEAASSGYFANLMLRSGPTAAPTPPAAAAPAPGSDTTVVTPAPAPQQAATTPAGGGDIAPEVQQQIALIITRSAVQGEMAERDRDYLAQLVAANSNMTQTEARARVDEVNEEIAQARAVALEAVEQARIAGVIFGFIAAATLLIGALAAFFAAAAGGRHRDDGLGLDIFSARR